MSARAGQVSSLVIPKGASNARRWRSAIAEAGPVLLVVLGLSVKLLYFVRIVYPRPHDWSNARAWLTGVTLATLGSIGTLSVVTAPLFLLGPRTRAIVAWCMNLTGTVLIIADVLYLRYYADILSVSAMADVGQVGMISDSVIALLRPRDALFFADLVVTAALLVRYGHALESSAEPRSRRWLAAAALLVGALLSIIPIRAILGGRPMSYMAHLKVRGAGRIGLFNYHAYDWLRQMYYRRSAETLSPSDTLRARAVLAHALQEQAPSPLHGTARGRNLILVMVESLEQFVLDLRVDGREVTPNLNAFARRSMAFDNVYSQAWHGATSDGEFASLQSLHPLTDGAVPTLLADRRFRALPQVLDEAGYGTLSIHGAPGAMWSVRAMHQRYGIQRSYFLEDLQADERLGMGLSDGSFFRQSLPALAREREPFFAYLITLSTHHPYRLPATHTRLPVGEFEGSQLGRYLQSVHYFDEAFGSFLQALDSTGLLDRSVVVLYGDHPANYGKGEALARLLATSADDAARSRLPERLWIANQRIAFVVHLPGDAHAGVSSVPAGHLDIAPTLLDLLGVQDAGMVSLGRNVLRAPTSSVVFRDGSFVRGDTLCLAASAQHSGPWCRDVRTGSDVPARFERAAFAEAQDRLEVSDLLLGADLIPWASALARRGGGR